MTDSATHPAWAAKPIASVGAQQWVRRGRRSNQKLLGYRQDCRCLKENVKFFYALVSPEVSELKPVSML